MIIMIIIMFIYDNIILYDAGAAARRAPALATDARLSR